MRIRFVDAFTDRPFAGNPAAVVLLDEPGFPDDARLQRLAAEVNLSETAFAHPLPAGEAADWALRWFTPLTEVDLCGHATLATAHVLRGDGLLDGTVRFATHSGVLTARCEPSGGITLDFPTATLAPTKPTERLRAALGAEVTAAYTTGQLGDLLVEVADEDTVRQLAPDLAALARLPQRGVIVTAPGAAATRGDGTGRHDFVSRFFGPAVGVDEDPVTGSAHTALAPLWCARLGRDTLTGYQASPRGGTVHVRLHGERTALTGHAVTVIDGRLQTAP